MDYWTIMLSIVMGLLGVYYLFNNFNYFKRNGIFHAPPVLAFGMVSFALRRISFADYLQKIYYFEPNAKYLGFYFINRPVILLRDPELMKKVFIKDFDSFPNRRGFGEFNETMLTNNLFSLRGKRWRNIRALLSPTFTSSRMKIMYTFTSECAVKFAKALSETPADMDMKDVFSKYATDVITMCALGIKVDSVSDSTNNFYLYGKEATRSIGTRGVLFLLFRTFSRLIKFFHLRFLSNDITNFFNDTIKTTIATRDAQNITRPDMIQLMMDNRGKHESEKELSIDDMIAQAFVIFFGSFDTSSIAMSFIAYEIAMNPDVQEKLQQEIDEVLENSNGEVNYEVIVQLKYLDAVINETVRLYPPVIFVERQCEKPYEFPPALPNKKPVILKKGQLVWIPIYQIHRDKKYYDEPEKFRPERFLDNTHKNSCCYLPFGLGQRMCIAKRFALMEIKVLMFHLLARCELKPCAKTTIPVKLGTDGLDPMMEGGFWLNVQRRNNSDSTKMSKI